MEAAKRGEAMGSRKEAKGRGSLERGELEKWKVEMP
ncbi:hypothetical protein QG37_07112 [Candidozyma auris]|uniref:Uncharacterized protein n=1 Tax=Candidozyma auris TaxID=498019 RepID=A0A0L0NR99_CANAR|nr:hypothetical protein QG37_07112 [[Candida] auris]